MISLAIKYRPKTFEDVTGQGAIKSILEYQIQNKCNQNCYLFTGGAGTGKTTCARIFANELNNGQGLPIEIDAASNNGVEQVRKIIDDAKYKSLDADFKVYILDECFSANTLVKTPKGSKPIKNIHVGNVVNNMTGQDRVTNVFKSNVLTNHLCLVKIGNKKIYTTKNHLFFTNIGWVEACNLKKGDIVYNSSFVAKLKKDVLSCLSQNKSSTLFSNAPKESILVSSENLLPTLQQKIFYPFDKVDNKAIIRIKVEDDEFRIQFGLVEAIFSKNFVSEKRKIGKWEMCASIAEVVERFKNWAHISDSKEIPMSYQLQLRNCLFHREGRDDRGGWERPILETLFIVNQEKETSFDFPCVESVDVYKKGQNDELFLDSFTKEELNSEFVIMYDLEVENDHTYFANDILVHNCHMLSTGAWNAMLKLLEEPPAKTIFIMCTTDPQKIPNTILSRVQRFDFQRIPANLIVDRLKYVAKQENINVEEDALQYIAKLANGGMRDALTLLDKCFSYNYEVDMDNVIQALGVANYQILFDLLTDIYNANNSNIINCIDDVHMSGKDLKQFIRQFYFFLVDLRVYQITNSLDYTQIPDGFKAQCSNFVFNVMTDNLFLSNICNTVHKLLLDIKWEQNPRPFILTELIQNDF